jgi:hypothetical protein
MPDSSVAHVNFLGIEDVVDAAVTAANTGSEAVMSTKSMSKAASGGNSTGIAELRSLQPGAISVNVSGTNNAGNPSDPGRRWVVHNSLSYSQSTGVLRSQSASSQSNISVSGKTPAQLASSRSEVQLTATAGENDDAENDNVFNTNRPGSSATPRLVFPTKHKALGSNGGAMMAHNTHNEVIIDRLSLDITNIAEQLDDSKREVEMQRREIARLKRMMMKSANPSLPSPTQAGVNAFRQSAVGLYNDRSRSLSPVNYEYDRNDIANLSMEDSSNNQESSIVVGLKQAIKIDRSLTHADVTGRPSENELKDLALVPIYVNADGKRAVSVVRPAFSIPLNQILIEVRKAKRTFFEGCCHYRYTSSFAGCYKRFDASTDEREGQRQYYRSGYGTTYTGVILR